MNVELPPGWAATTLGEIGLYHNGRAFKPSDWVESGRPIIRIQDLTGSRTAPHYFDGPVDPRNEVAPGDLLISWAATLGAYIWHGPPAVLNQHTFKVESFVDRRFHYYAAQAIIADLYTNSHGSGMVHITKGKFEDTPIPLPPLAEQRRIVDVLETHFTRVDAAVASLERARANLRRYRTAVLLAAVEGRLIEARTCEAAWPPSWTWSTVADVAEDVRFGSSAKTEGDATGVPVLRMGNLQDGEIDLSTLKYLPASHHEFPDLYLQPGDILFNRTNSPELVGKSAVYRGTPSPCSFASYLIRVRLTPCCNPEFLTYWLNSPHGRTWVKSVVVQQVGQANVNGTKLRAFRFAMPDRKVQETIVAEVQRLLSSCDAAASSIETDLLRCARLRQSLLRTTFEGRLAPQDPADEPASVLLNRIRTDRAAAAPSPKRKPSRTRP
jgi:type I restriction enzyme S subunit